MRKKKLLRHPNSIRNLLQKEITTHRPEQLHSPGKLSAAAKETGWKEFSPKTLFKSTSRRKISVAGSLFGSNVINGISLRFSSAPFGTIEHLLFRMGVKFRTFPSSAVMVMMVWKWTKLLFEKVLSCLRKYAAGRDSN
ncbi:hypothetical protein HNY73_003579 [Argiope bruennichi]|uniref:Uncharacterized protein n=1 Tax=Argiope bruennichi TaxID=94029 RepID=A0A8T0FT98_ARGBR|nr:hypothetical protein HNY73_003579 [Argiope bruennichi]